jgi:negative regulator of sigma-B (phosphoserine phosphatase)
MTAGARSDGSILHWGWAGSALEEESGDLHVVVPFPGGAVVALIDGLGHGPEAAVAARAAATVVGTHAAESVVSIVERCHTEIHKTRGAVMSVASFDVSQASMTWIGVGNVEAVLLRGHASSEQLDEAIAVRGGVVGYQMPPLRAKTVPVAAGDTLIMATDGIGSGFTSSLARASSPQEIAESILARFAKGSDDAHVVVARYLGAAS